MPLPVLSGGSQPRVCVRADSPKAAAALAAASRGGELLVARTLEHAAVGVAVVLSLGRRPPGFGGHRCSLSFPLTVL